jgi:phage-related tail fiber protein
MANLIDAPDWAPIRQLETTDRVVGGAAGVANIQAQQLANRTAFLSQQIDAVDDGLSALADTVSAQGANNAVTNAKLADVASQTIKGRTAIGAGDPQDLTVAQVKAMLGLEQVDNTADADKPVSTAAQAALVAKSGGTMTGPLAVPAGATAAQVPQAQEVGSLANAQLGLAGAVAPFARSTAPTGWLKANGATVSRSTYAALFAAIGTTFGAGDGSTTFVLPDLRGEFLRGWDDGRGVDTPRAFGSAQTDLIKTHSHEINISPVAVGGALSSGQATFGTTRDGGYYGTTSMTGGGAETRPRNIALLYCIKY